MEAMPRSWMKRTVPAYKPARTPYVGHTVHYSARYGGQDVVIIRECDNATGTKDGNYWVAPILPDGTLGAMTTSVIYAQDFPRKKSQP